MRTHCYRSRSRRQKPPLSVHTRPPTRAANVSPPWCVIRTSCGENPALFGDDRASDQERRATARRGMVMQLQRCSCTDHRPVTSARQLRSSRCERVSKTTGGLRPPLLCCNANVFRRKTIFAMHKRTFSRAAGVSPPWCVIRTLCGENPALFGDDRASEQERRTSARRGMVMQLQRCSCTDHRPVASARQLGSSRCERVSKTTGGLRPPLLCCNANVFRRKNDFCDAQTHIRPRAAGVSPPWFGFALATAIGFCGLITFRTAQSPPYHGWLTPAALGCTRKSSQMGGGALQRRFVSHGGAYAPRSCAAMRVSAGEKRFLRCTNAHPTKSGGRQPAVVPIRACNGDRFLRTDYVSHRTVASVPRLAHASRSWGRDPSR